MAHAICFGLNYQKDQSSLRGCYNDAHHMADYIREVFPSIICDIYTDDLDQSNTSAQGLLSRLYDLAEQSYKDELKFALIHYSGHGISVKDYSGDELDHKDECLVPSDFRTCGFILDDALEIALCNFNPQTKVVCIFDCCHSGTICDLKYVWNIKGFPTIEHGSSKVEAKVIAISGCMDDQTSADAYNINDDRQFAGALTTCLIKTLKDNPFLSSNVFELLGVVRHKLKAAGFQQVPLISSSYDLRSDCNLF